VGRTFLAILIACGTVAGCRHGGLHDSVFTKGSVRYRIGPLPSDWKQESLKENDLAFMLDRTGHSIAINSTCEGYEDAPLLVLTQHLLAGFTERRLIKQESAMMDGRESLRSHYTARLDGVPIELWLVVLKKNGCIYDFTYLSPPGKTEEELGSFERLLEGFKVEAP
jgi:hypothetical protein